jgi:tetrahydromethanopterin S-methyltransferase subunit E
MSIEALATFFGWCTVINVGLLLLVLALTAAVNKEGFPFDLIARIFGITTAEVRATHFRVFQQYRFAIVMFNLAPYLAIKIAA